MFVNATLTLMLNRMNVVLIVYVALMCPYRVSKAARSDTLSLTLIDCKLRP